MLENKIIFITGSTRGIGWSTAQLLASQGATVLLNGVSSKALLQERVDELKKKHNREFDGFLFDAADPSAVKSAYEKIAQKYKTMDVLINNAGILDPQVLGTITSEGLDKTLDANVKSVIYNMQYASRLMMRKRKGSIINLSSIIGKEGAAGQIAYSASKAAVIGITLSGAKELAPFQIRVNAVAPGYIETDMTKKLSGSVREETLKNIKMGRPGKPGDVAKVILFLASDLSDYVTGQILGVDGGMLI